MIRQEVIALLDPAEKSAYATSALLHLLELAAWDLCNRLTLGSPVDRHGLELVSTIDRTVEIIRGQHERELEAITEAAFHFGSEARQ